MKFVRAGECHYCQRRTFEPGTPEAFSDHGRVGTADHVTPRSIGGRDVVLACARCNNARGDAPYPLFKHFAASRLPNSRWGGREFRLWLYSLAKTEFKRNDRDTARAALKEPEGS